MEGETISKRTRPMRRLAIAGLTIGLCVGAAALTARAVRAQAGVSTASVRLAETEAGNLVADAVRAAAQTDIAFIPAATFRPNANAPRTPTAEQIAALLDGASDTIVILNLKGEQIQAALERSVWFAGQPFGGYLQVSGLRLRYDARNEPGKRIVSVSIDGEPLEAGKSYKVATTRPLGNGANGYFQIWRKEQIASDTGKTLKAALEEFARSQAGPLAPGLDGRIAQVSK